MDNRLLSDSSGRREIGIPYGREIEDDGMSADMFDDDNYRKGIKTLFNN